MTRFTTIIFAILGLLATKATGEDGAPCPETPLSDGDRCDGPFASSSGQCRYGEFCCPDDPSICGADVLCVCGVNGIVSCSATVDLECPGVGEAPPMDGDNCPFDSEAPRFRYNYGDPFTCENPNASFEYERQCRCFFGQQLCAVNICPVPCPEVLPEEFSACTSFDGTCSYTTSLCCTDDVTSCHVQDISCIRESVIYSESATCPGIGAIPQSGDTCDKPGIKFLFGEPFTCDDDTSFDQIKECLCVANLLKFQCTTNACSVPCPDGDILLVEGTECDAPFVDFSCDAGKLCCPFNTTECVVDRRCGCESANAVNCILASTVCSAPADETFPVPSSGDICDIESRISQQYGAPFTCDNGEQYDYVRQCQCKDGTFECISNTCPVSCPEAPLVDGEACFDRFEAPSCDYGDQSCCPGDESNICVQEKSCLCQPDGLVGCFDRSIKCDGDTFGTLLSAGDACDFSPQLIFEYGEPVECAERLQSFDHERACRCLEGSVSCRENVCSVPCPETQPDVAESCVGFIGFRCDYGTFCCPDDASRCIDDFSCRCQYLGDSSVQIAICSENTLACTGICPVVSPQHGDSCDLDQRIECNYSDSCDDSLPNFCVCLEGSFSCSNPDCFATMPVDFPTEAPVGAPIDLPIEPPVDSPTDPPVNALVQSPTNGDDDDDDDNDGGNESGSKDSMMNMRMMMKKTKKGKLTGGGTGGSGRRLIRGITK